MISRASRDHGPGLANMTNAAARAVRDTTPSTREMIATLDQIASPTSTNAGLLVEGVAIALPRRHGERSDRHRSKSEVRRPQKTEATRD
jgi:hypothetical protein